jgi:hypothetical protein
MDSKRAEDVEKLRADIKQCRKHFSPEGEVCVGIRLLGLLILDYIELETD